MTHTRKLALVACSVLLSISCSVSKADIITVPLINGLSVTIGTGTNAGPLQNLNTNPGATNITMGDDSSVNVPLGFSFPYFGKTFTDSWMYSNGAISFVGPNAPGAFCCEGLNLTTLRDPGYNYSITPLWTDLIAIEGGSHYKLGTPTSMTYGWYGVSEYYDPTKRNSFEVKIDNTGLVDVRFAGAFVAFHPVTSGFIGDIEKGEYYQHHYGNGFQTGPVSYALGGKIIMEDPCLKDPLSSPSCPGYATALLKSLPVTTTTAVELPSGVVEPISVTTSPTQSTAVIAAPTTVETVAPAQTIATSSSNPSTPSSTPTATVSIATTTSTPSVSNPQPKVGEVSSSSSPKVSLSMIMNIVSAEQTRISGVEKSVVQESVSLAVSASQQAVATAESTASASATGSMSTQSVGGSSVGSFNTTLTPQTITSSSGFNQFGFSGQGIQVNGLQTNQSFDQSTTSNATIGSMAFAIQPKPVTEVEVVKSEGSRLGGQSALDVLIEKPTSTNQSSTNTGADTVRKVVSDNEAAAGVTIASIATQPVGYSAYFSVLKDAVFYAPKEVYQNQRVIDNQRILRQLSNDSLHQQLLEQQYNRGN